MTAREEFEAAIWRALRSYQVTVYAAVPFVETLLAAADAYATTQGGITADRRHVLAQATARTIHFGDRTHACLAKIKDPALTTDPAKVTCGRCKHSRAWRTAAVTAGCGPLGAVS